MMNIFTLASNDQSMYYLGKIFGNIGGVLPVTDGPLLLGVMFKVLNTAALSVGGLIVVYTTVMGLLSTASEGEFLGKKWSGLWVPVRTVLGIVGLFPSSGGYCAIQVIIMWLILQGIGLGDTLWTAVLTMMARNDGSIYVTVPFPNIDGAIKTSMQDLFRGLVCYESLSYKTGINDEKIAYPYYCKANPTDDLCTKDSLPPFNPASGVYQLGSYCGTLNFCKRETECSGKKSNSLNCLLCEAQLQVLPEIIFTFDSIAKQVAQMDFEYQKFYYTSNKDTAKDTPQWIQDFCTAQGKSGKCCVNAVPPQGMELLAGALIDDTTCSTTFFTSTGGGYPPNSVRGGNEENKGSVGERALKEIYIPYGLAPYTDKIDFIAAASQQYVGVLTGAYASTNIQPTTLSTANQEASNNGWILAGMYYHNITQGNAKQQVNTKTLPNFSYTIDSPEGNFISPIRDVRNNVQAMKQLLTAIKAAGQPTSFAAPSSPGISDISETADMGTMVSSFMSDVTGESSRVVGKEAQNPIYKISVYGYNLIWSTQLLFWITVAITTVAATVSSLNLTALGTGMTTSIIYEGFKTFTSFVGPFWALGLSTLFSVGVMLGIYLPLIPYTIYTMGAIGWLMATIEAMVAGPIIALGILSPSGQHEILGKSEPAVMIIFNLILRPSLMVFGLMASLILAVPVVTMVNQGFAKVAYNIISHPGLVEGILFMVAYASLIIMVMNKVFTLIHVIPEKILTYIGGQAISYGESEAMAPMKQAMEGAGSGISGGGKESAGAPAAGTTKMREAGIQAKAIEDKKKKESGPGTTATSAPALPSTPPPGMDDKK